MPEKQVGNKCWCGKVIKGSRNGEGQPIYLDPDGLEHDLDRCFDFYQQSAGKKKA